MLITFNSFFLSLNAIQSATTYIDIVGIACAGINVILISMLTYFFSFLMNLTVPNQHLPWANVSHMPSIMKAIANVSIVLTYRCGSSGSDSLFYIFACFGAFICIYRLYVSITRYLFFNYSIHSVVTLCDSIISHFLVMLIVTSIQEGHG